MKGAGGALRNELSPAPKRGPTAHDTARSKAARRDEHGPLEHPAAVVGADQHGGTVEVEDSNGVAVGVEHVVVGGPVLPSARARDEYVCGSACTARA